MSTILGINCYGHDSAATLVQDGIVRFAAEEERFSREKHSGKFPEHAIADALRFCDISFSDIEHVGFSWDPMITYMHIPEYVLRFWKTLPILLRERQGFSMEENLGMLNYLKDIKNIPQTLEKRFLGGQKGKFKFHLLEHHMCHAASCFYPSEFEEAAILTIDGAGEWSTTMMASGQGNRIRKLGTVNTPHSLGAFYQAISRYLGFKLIEGPGKLMGLASYGKRNSAEYEKMKELVFLKPDGRFALDMKYFCYHYSRRSGVSDLFIQKFGAPNTTGRDWDERQLNIAAAAQQLVEDTIFHLLHHLQKKTGARNLCMAGGVALNSVTNGLVAKSGLFENIFIQPAAGDSGTSFGAALLIENGIFRRPRRYVQRDAFLGPDYSAEAYESALARGGFAHQRMDRDAMYRQVARKLLGGDIVGWLHGRMEFGPRALGNRSFLATPLKKEMKDILNARVKFRESFRPFAAIVLQEDAGKYFDYDHHNPYMLFVYNVKEEYRDIIPAITHVDHSVRVQTVNREENPELYALLLAFKEISGHGVLINTSFNIKGEPIVCSPEDAVKSFARADIDALVMGDYIAEKQAAVQTLTA